MSNMFKGSAMTIDKCKEEAEYIDPRVDKGIINDRNGSSVVARETGDVNLTASKYAQYKLSKSSGQATEISIKSHTKTVRKALDTDEVSINNHKLNPQLVELSDMRQALSDKESAIGNLTMGATVLVKTWEEELQRYVLVRRQARMPVFYQELNLENSPEQVGIDTRMQSISNIQIEDEVKVE